MLSDEPGDLSSAAAPPTRLLHRAGSPWRGRGSLLLVLVATAVARVVYYVHWGVQFDDSTLSHYVQYVDPPLLRARLLESTLYLRDQPPLFNLFLGVVLKAFPHGSKEVFCGVFLTCGLLLAASLFTVLVRMQIPTGLSAALTLMFSVHPATILYENWLFYTYPVACLLCLSALFLHRYVDERKMADGLAFAVLLALVVLTRGAFHVFWLLLIVGGLFLVQQGRRKQVILVSLIPILLVFSVYLKNYILFGKTVSGKFILSSTLMTMTVGRLPPAERERLVRSGELTPLSSVAVPRLGRIEIYERILGRFKDTGIAVLDQRIKASGAVNFHHHAWDTISVWYERDATYILRRYPRLYLEGVWENCKRYFRPAGNYGFPHLGSVYPNRRSLHRLLDGAAHVQTTKFDWIVLSSCIVFATGFAGRWLLIRWRRGAHAPEAPGDATGCTVLFCLFNILYLAFVTVTLSDGDHNRYRFKVTPLYFVIGGLLAWTLWNRCLALVARAADRG